MAPLDSMVGPRRQLRAQLEQDMGLEAGALEKGRALQAGRGKLATGPPRRTTTRLALTQSRKKTRAVYDATSDSDGEEVLLCRQCHLPVGELAYASANGTCHGECMAELLLQDMRKKEQERLQEDQEKKEHRRAEYDIGWRAASIPHNEGPASSLAGRQVPDGPCCLVYDDESHSVRVAATLEPASAVNLEYLSIALDVRRREGREPMFSLDPADPHEKHSMQLKRFEPAWLAGTSVGEVMFQADYHLKELSMGEYAQPVLGMRNCIEHARAESFTDAWSAREWFLVKKAEVYMSEDNVLLPSVRMGVEAREQLKGEDGTWEDARLTRQDHPLVKYSDEFSHNFDLIAERRSVVYHLREVAKASVVAKFLLDAEMNLEEEWYHLAGEPKDTPMEVPQLWNERTYSQIFLKDGKILDAQSGSGRHGVYGGVQFGLDRFARVAAGVRAEELAPRQHRLMGHHGFSRIAYSPISTMMTFASTTLGPKVRAPVPAAALAPQGVDLNLDQFNLSEAKRVPLEASLGGDKAADGLCRPLDECRLLGDAFWANLEAGGFKQEDQQLLKAVFNPSLSDRRQQDQALFVPPDLSQTYAQRLGRLVSEEEKVRQQRRELFCSKHFAAGDPGPLFPSSWTPLQERALGGAKPLKVVERPPGSLLQARPDYQAEQHLFQHTLKSIEPSFDKTAEDGTRYRIYHCGSVEMRTIQDHDTEESIVVIFSFRTPSGLLVPGRQGGTINGDERIVKVTEYVERAMGMGRGGRSPVYRRYYTVLDTEKGNRMVTEMLEDGAVTLEECPVDLEDRNSLAKVLRTAECGGDITAADIRSHQEREAKRVAAGYVQPTSSQCKRYARGAFGKARALCAGQSQQPLWERCDNGRSFSGMQGALSAHGKTSYPVQQSGGKAAVRTRPQISLF